MASSRASFTWAKWRITITISRSIFEGPVQDSTGPDFRAYQLLILFHMKQIFCRKCSGLKHVIVEGRTVPPEDWMKLGLASDIGCLCSAARRVAREQQDMESVAQLLARDNAERVARGEAPITYTTQLSKRTFKLAGRIIKN